MVEVYVEGDLALFSKPEHPVDRVSYPAPPFSALRGLVEAILWKRGMRWEVMNAYVLNPLRYHQIMRNEMDHTQPTNAMQRKSLFLAQVAYVFSAVPVITEPCDDTDKVAKYEIMLRRYVGQGRCFRRPYLGMRECLAHVGIPPLGWKQRAANANKAALDLGTMPHFIPYEEGVPGRTVFARYAHDPATGRYAPAGVQ